jgi:hypothetical protein
MGICLREIHGIGRTGRPAAAAEQRRRRTLQLALPHHEDGRRRLAPACGGERTGPRRRGGRASRPADGRRLRGRGPGDLVDRAQDLVVRGHQQLLPARTSLALGAAGLDTCVGGQPPQLCVLARLNACAARSLVLMGPVDRGRRQVFRLVPQVVREPATRQMRPVVLHPAAVVRVRRRYVRVD